MGMVSGGWAPYTVLLGSVCHETHSLFHRRSRAETRLLARRFTLAETKQLLSSLTSSLTSRLSARGVHARRHRRPSREQSARFLHDPRAILLRHLLQRRQLRVTHVVHA